MFDNVTKSQKIILYQALIHAVRSNSGIGFANRDQRHPAYTMGANGTIDEQKWGDSPQANDLYQMITALAPDVRDEVATVVMTWEDFCGLAVKAGE
jgi:hypothetical protein